MPTDPTDWAGTLYQMFAAQQPAPSGPSGWPAGSASYPQPGPGARWPQGAVQPPVPSRPSLPLNTAPYSWPVPPHSRPALPNPPPLVRPNLPSAAPAQQQLDPATLLRLMMNPPPAPVRGMHGYAPEPWQSDRWGDVAATRPAANAPPSRSVGGGLHKVPNLDPPRRPFDRHYPYGYRPDPTYQRGFQLKSGQYPEAPNEGWDPADPYARFKDLPI